MSNTTTIPLASKDATSSLLPTVHIKAMVKALESCGLFTINADWHDAETVDAVHTSTNREVFAAIHKGNGHWIVRHHKKLFA